MVVASAVTRYLWPRDDVAQSLGLASQASAAGWKWPTVAHCEEPAR